MQNKRGAILGDNSQKIISELTEKLNDQSKIIQKLEKENSDLKRSKEFFDVTCCTYNYSEKEWDIPKPVISLLGLPESESINSVNKLFTYLNPEHKDTVIDQFNQSLEYRLPFEYSGNLYFNQSPVSVEIKAKAKVDNEAGSENYTCFFSFNKSDNPENKDIEPKHRLTEETLDNLPIAYFVIDPQYKWEYVNKHWEKTFGFSFDEVEGKNVDCVFPDYSKKEIYDRLKKIFSGETINMEYSFLGPDKATKYFSINIHPVYSADKKITGAEGFCIDVTENKIIEEKMKIQEEKYNIISRNIPVVVYSRIPGEIYKPLFISGGIKHLTGFNVDKFFDDESAWRGIIYPDDYKNYLKKNNEQLETLTQLNIEYRIITSENKVKWIRDVATPLTDESGKIIKINGFIEDISDRKNAERALKLSEKKFRSIFENSRDCIYLTTEEGQFIDINIAGLNLTGYSKEEILTLNAASLYVDIADRFRFKRILEKYGYVKDFEFKLRKRNGEIRECILTSSANRNDIGEIKGYQGIIRDVTEKKKAERDIIFAKEEAEKADRIKTEFLAQMSHEIRTPINTILSFSSLISDEMSEILSPQSEEYFSILDRAGIRIIRTIDLILNMSELQSGSYNYVLQSVDLSAILYDLYAEYKSHASERGLQLHLNLDESEEVIVQGDEYSITQIIGNLIDNAIKYTETGSVKVGVDNSNGQTDLIVEDTGIGISSDYISNLFEAFSQEEQGYTRKFEGSGLGLALVKKYCDINKADISVESTKGEGSKFIVTFNK